MQLQRTQSKYLSSKTMHCSSDCTENQETCTWLLLKIIWAFQITCQDIPSSWAAQPNFFASTPKSSSSTSSPSAVPLILWLQIFLKSAVSNLLLPVRIWQHLLMWQKQMLSPLLDLTQIHIVLQLLFILSKLTKPSLPWTAIFGLYSCLSFISQRKERKILHCSASLQWRHPNTNINNLHVTRC